jgi:hypothetical protein
MSYVIDRDGFGSPLSHAPARQNARQVCACTKTCAIVSKTEQLRVHVVGRIRIAEAFGPFQYGSPRKTPKTVLVDQFIEPTSLSFKSSMVGPTKSLVRVMRNETQLRFKTVVGQPFGRKRTEKTITVSSWAEPPPDPLRYPMKKPGNKLRSPLPA